MTTTGLLQTLGLRSPAGNTRPGGKQPGGPTGPTGPIKRPHYDPPDEVRQPAKEKGSGTGGGAGKDLSDDELKKILSSLPTDPVKRTEVVADAVSRITDIARRDPIARALRDWLAKKQPFTSDANARKKLDEGIKSLVEKGIKEGLLALVSGVLGKEPGKIDRDQKAKDPITTPENDTGEHIVKSPEFDLPIDKPGKVKHTNFQFLSAPTSVTGGKYFSIKLRTPTNFKPGKAGSAYVAISSKADFDAKSPRRASDVKFDSKGDLSLSIVAPLEAGRYVMYVVVGPSREEQPLHELDVIVPTSGTKAPGGAAPPKGAINDTDLKDKLKSLPTGAPQRVLALAELATEVSEPAKRDPIVKALRGLIVKLQPVVPDDGANKAIDDAIGDLVGKGALDGIRKLLEGVAGKKAEAVK
jgi:hypothetical protein